MRNMHRRFIGYFVTMITFTFLYCMYLVKVSEGSVSIPVGNLATSTLKSDAVRDYKPDFTIPHEPPPPLTKNPTIVPIKPTKPVQNVNSTRSFLKKEDKKIKILLASHFWQHANFPGVNTANKLCPKCFFTSNRSTWNESSALVFHSENTWTKMILNRRFDPNQIWVLMMFESPKNSKQVMTGKFGNMFNWTMSYRRDSDIFAPYGRFHLISKKRRPNISSAWAFSTGKASKDLLNSYVVTPSVVHFHARKLSAWISSRCKTDSLRETVIKGLQVHMDIDVYGKCGPLRCAVPNKKTSGVDCRLQLQNRYKFYFALENSLCEDYVTEKFFDIVGLTDMVPVVYGGVDYRTMFPPKSFINVRDFETAESLAKYLEYVGSNATAWLEYFEYRKSYWVQTDRFAVAYCDLCNKMVQRSRRNPWVKRDDWQTYTNVGKWWTAGSNSTKPACVDPATIPIVVKKRKLRTLLSDDGKIYKKLSR